LLTTVDKEAWFKDQNPSQLTSLLLAVAVAVVTTEAGFSALAVEVLVDTELALELLAEIPQQNHL
jgi:hypothetical protein